MCEDGHLHVVDGAAILFGQTGYLVDNGLVGIVEDALLPTCLGKVHLALYRANGIEIFLADIASGKATCYTAQQALRNTRHEAYVAKLVAAVQTDG